MTNIFRISVFCPDQTGLVASITGSLFDLGANLAATSFNVLGTGAEFTAVGEFPEDVAQGEIESNLEALSPLLGQEIKISVSPFTLEPTQGPSGQITHRLYVSGGDRPGLIARLCEVFGQYKANIVRMNAERIPQMGEDQYVIHFAVWLDPDKTEKCIATVDNTAGEMKLSCKWDVL